MRQAAAAVGLLCLAAAAAFASPQREAAVPDVQAPLSGPAAPAAVPNSLGQSSLLPSLQAPTPAELDAAAASVDAAIRGGAETGAGAGFALPEAASAETGSATSFATGQGGRSSDRTAAGASAALRQGVSADAVFDGRQATSADVLAKIEQTVGGRRDATAAIANARGVDGAVAGLARLGVLKPSAAPTGSTLRRYLVQRVWDRTSSLFLSRNFAAENDWAVPAIRVRNGSTTYLIHPVHHGRVFAVNGSAVRRLIRQIAAKGEALYSEQRFPAFFGYSYGRELNDHQAVQGQAPAAYAPGVMEPARRQAIQLNRSVAATFYSAASGLALTLAASWGGPIAAGLVALAAAAAGWTLFTGLLGYDKLHTLWLARRAARAGFPDVAEQLEREAQALFRRRVAALDALRLSLPPDAVGALDANGPRSQAMAEAVAAEGGPGVVHVLVGHRHAGHVAWRLSQDRGDRKS